MQLLFDGLKLMVLGMGTVFLFLCVMILWILLSSKLSVRFKDWFPVEPVVAAPRRKAVAPAPGQQDQGRLIAVIAAAIQMYRKDQSNSK